MPFIIFFLAWKIFKIFEILPFRERERGRERFLKFYHLPITIYLTPYIKNFH